MKYAYEDLSFTQFENLIILICHELLGAAIQAFSEGRDGGRDAKFVGTAHRYPSESTPWQGKVIIQAKHTNGNNKSFSDSDFFSIDRKSNIVEKEIPRIKGLIKKNDIDHYMLFSNRRLTGNTDAEITKYIINKTELKEGSVRLFGIEQIERYLKQYPDIVKLANIDPIDSPLLVSPHDLAEIIEGLAKYPNVAKKIIDNPPVQRTSYEEKNEINNMSVDYAKAWRNRYLKETEQIRDFLGAPENSEYVKLYESVVDEFQFKVLAKRKAHQTFDEVIEYIIDQLFNRDPVLSKNRKLTRIMLFYMYWNCDLGKNEHA